LIAWAVAAPSPVAAWTLDEHRLLADSALSVATLPLDSLTRARLRGALRAPWTKHPRRDAVPTFGSVCTAAASDDHSTGRYQLAGRTVREQLEKASAARIDTLANRALRGDRDLLQGDRRHFQGRVQRLNLGNVVANYLVQHVTALRIAEEAAGGRAHAAGSAPGADAAARDPDSLLRRALLYEAVALGFLADAFSAGHLMPPAGGRLGFLEPINRRRLDDYYGTHGIYVLDARGETWYTHGDRLMLWYGPSFDHVFDACVASLREVLAAGGVTGPDALAPSPPELARAVPGPEWLTRVRLAALLRIPTVAVATWSVRTDSLDPHGLRARYHYPQLRETGGHDPTLEPDEVRRLPPVAAVPDWMVAPEMFRTDPLVLVREHPDYASARFVQPERPPPSYRGVVLSVGWVHYDRAGDSDGHARYGLGYSPPGESGLLIQRLSIDAVSFEPITSDGPRAVALSVGFNLKLPGLGVWDGPWLRWLEHTRVSAGHAWDSLKDPHADGARYTAGLESSVLPLGFTDAAVCLRLEAEWWRFRDPRHGLALTVVMQ